MAFFPGSPSPLDKPPAPFEGLPKEGPIPEAEADADRLTSVEADREALAVLQAEQAKAAASDAHFLEPAAGEAVQDPLLLKTEGILEAGLDGLLNDLKEDQRAAFTAAGKELAQKLFLAHRNLKGEDVVNLVQRWLHVLPGVSKPYLGQEALLKTMALLQMFKQEPSSS